MRTQLWRHENWSCERGGWLLPHDESNAERATAIA